MSFVGGGSTILVVEGLNGLINKLRVLISIRPVAGVAGEGCIGVNAEVVAVFQDSSELQYAGN